MNTGKYRHRIKILSRIQGTDDYGAPVPDGWTVYKTVWATIEPLRRGHEFFRSDQTQTIATYDIKMRYMQELTADMHILHGGIYYNIDAVLQDNCHMETVARCHIYSSEQYDQLQEPSEPSQPEEPSQPSQPSEPEDPEEPEGW